jgi:coenzyme F420-reducing hydrogenase delta subunit/quinol-cytochrome oxidoreductase complex cytochrome b subunit
MACLRFRPRLRHTVLRVESLFDVAFGERLNPLHHLGALGFFFFWVVLASGVYLFTFFDTGITAAYQSVEDIAHHPLRLGILARGLHRYASDAMVVVVLLHLLREWVYERYHGFRWYSWITGVPLLWLMYASGVNGFWLAWDQLAQYIAQMTAEWFDALPIFSEPVARNFLNAASVNDRIFTLQVFLHLGLPLFLLFATWVHVQRITNPKTTPPRALMLGSLAMLALLALFVPVVPHAPANLDVAVGTLRLDWIFLSGYPLIELWSPGAVWVLALGITLLLAVAPWLPARHDAPVAVVDPANCNGCARCFADCPFAAIVMAPHPDKPGHKLAVVDAKLCAACGICAGSCPSATPFRSIAELVSGIDMPALTVHRLREQVAQGLERLRGEARVVVFGCEHAADVARLEGESVAAYRLPCTGNLPPAFVDYVLRGGRADGVLVTGCNGGDCHFRFGNDWTEQRFAGTREPHLRTRAARERVHLAWAGENDLEKLKRELDAYRERLCHLPRLVAPAAATGVALRRRVSHG